MNLCDIHILRLNEPEAWFMMCKNSLRDSLSNVHVVSGIENELGRARQLGFSLGECPFVACADADDVYVSSTIKLLLAHMKANPKLGIAYSGEFRWDYATGEKKHLYRAFSKTVLNKTPMLVHGFTVFRRSAVLPFLPYLPAFKTTYELWFLSLAIVRAGWGVFGTPIIGRWWRKHSNQTSQKKNLNDKQTMTDFITQNKFPEAENA